MLTLQTAQGELARQMVAAQHGIDPATIMGVDFRRMGWGEQWWGSLSSGVTGARD